MTMASAVSTTQTTSPRRYLQLLLGILCMVMIANLQYGWTLFVNPMMKSHDWKLADVQWAFTLFVLLETWPVPFEGYFIDKFGPKVTVLLGGVLVGISWSINSVADTLAMLYLGMCIGGVGAGIVYGASVGSALKWFPDRRGLAAGLTAAGFGAGAAITTVPIAETIANHGYQTAFLWFGIGQGLLVMVFSFFLRAPKPGEVSASKKVVQGVTDVPPQKAIATPVFWLMYLMFVLVGTGGLMATAQLGPIAKDFKVADVSVSFLWITLPALTFALSIDRILNGICRPFFGWVSDHIGRENTMFIAFLIEAIGILALLNFANNPILFVLLSGLVFFAWGEIYSLFPATCGDIFGQKFATTNYGMLYTAKGTAALLVPLGSYVVQSTGSWTYVFYIASAFNLAAALLALFVLKPYRKRLTARGGL